MGQEVSVWSGSWVGSLRDGVLLLLLHIAFVWTRCVDLQFSISSQVFLLPTVSKANLGQIYIIFIMILAQYATWNKTRKCWKDTAGQPAFSDFQFQQHFAFQRFIWILYSVAFNMTLKFGNAANWECLWCQPFCRIFKKLKSVELIRIN